MVGDSCSVIIGALIWPHEGVNEASSLSSFYQGPGLGGHYSGDPAESRGAAKPERSRRASRLDIARCHTGNGGRWVSWR